MPEDEEKKEDSEADAKTVDKAAELASLRDTHTGITRQLGKPLVDKTKESLASKVEEIQSQYQQLKSYKNLAVTGLKYKTLVKKSTSTLNDPRDAEK